MPRAKPLLEVPLRLPIRSVCAVLCSMDVAAYRLVCPPRSLAASWPPTVPSPQRARGLMVGWVQLVLFDTARWVGYRLGGSRWQAAGWQVAGEMEVGGGGGGGDGGATFIIMISGRPKPDAHFSLVTFGDPRRASTDARASRGYIGGMQRSTSFEPTRKRCEDEN